jgi:hypothetical protein
MSEPQPHRVTCFELSSDRRLVGPSYQTFGEGEGGCDQPQRYGKVVRRIGAPVKAHSESKDDTDNNDRPSPRCRQPRRKRDSASTTASVTAGIATSTGPR